MWHSSAISESRSPAPRRLPMASCENTWAGRFVISLQLFSWCAVGVLLLQRGVASIRDDVARQPPNATQTPIYRAETNLSDLANTLADKSTLESSHQNKIAAKSGLIEKHNTEPFEGISENNIDKHTGNVHNLTAMTNSSGTLITPPSLVDHPTVTQQNETVKKISTPKTSSTFHNVRVPQAAGKSYELTPSGAVMAAIGALMLIVGPAIVVARCCESYSQGRRFNKLSANERALYERDLPPTYEEVEGRAPRYSMLFPDPEESNQSMLPDPEEESSTS